MSETGDGVARFSRFLVAYRLLLYFGALLAMSLPLGLAWLGDTELPWAVRTAIVVVSFAVIVATYLAERHVGLDHVDPQTGAPAEEYPTRMRVGVVFAVAGLAVGVYFALADRPFVGLLFLGGAVLFLQMAFRSDGAGE